MPNVTVKATIPLTDYAQAHISQLRFGIEDTSTILEKSVPQRKVNWFSRTIERLYSSTSPIAQLGKVLLLFTLAVSLVGIPIILLWHKEGRLSKKDAKAREVALDILNMTTKQLNKRAEVVENLQIQDFQNLPILDLKGRMKPTEYIDFLEPTDLSAPLMKGIDKFGRPFLALHLRDNQNSDTFVATLFQIYTNKDNWTWIATGGFSNPLESVINGIINPNEESIFSDIIHGKHDRFTLAN